jgi:hypothetical protein
MAAGWCAPQPAEATESTGGVVGWEAVGDIELLAKEPFRGLARGDEVSFSHEARRTGRGGWLIG